MRTVVTDNYEYTIDDFGIPGGLIVKGKAAKELIRKLDNPTPEEKARTKEVFERARKIAQSVNYLLP
jgi:hypothetical protein